MMLTAPAKPKPPARKSHYEPTILHTVCNRRSGHGRSEDGFSWFAEQLRRDIDRGWRHFWNKPCRKGLEPPAFVWKGGFYAPRQ